MALASLLVSICAVAISAISLGNSLRTSRHTRRASLLPQRLLAIDHVRSALTDVTMHARIDGRTSSSLREAYQLSKVVFSKRLCENMQKLASDAYQMSSKPSERKTDRDLDKEHALGDELLEILAAMQSEATLSN